MSEKTIDFSKTVLELCSTDAEVAKILGQLGFTEITKPGMLVTAGRIMTVPRGAAMKNIAMDTVEQEFIRHGYKIIQKEE